MQKKVAPITEWKEWLLHTRHISEQVIEDAGLAIQCDKQLLVIPVRDANGKHLFNKYRRSPWDTESKIKYLYDKGSSAALFGIESIGESKDIIITEGELDSLALRSLGYCAVSTTGGSSTFPVEWVKVFENRDPILMYDADKAGVEGMMKVLFKMPHARIAWTPVEFGKDITEVIHNGGTERLKRSISLTRKYPQKLDDMIMCLREERQYVLQEPDETPFHIDIAFDFIRDQIVKQKAINKTKRVKVDLNATDIERARAYPIQNIVQVRSGFARCIYHNEKTSSMKVFKDNHAFSFCCGKRSDAIDIYRHLNNCSFKEAVDFLKK